MADTIPSWDELLDAGVTAAEAARARGVSTSAAKLAACRRKRSWKSAAVKVTDEALRKIAKKNPTIDEVLEAFGIGSSTAYRRVQRLKGIVFYQNRLWTNAALKKAHAAEREAKRLAEERATERKEQRRLNQAIAKRREAAARERAEADRKLRACRANALSVSPAAIERYLAKTAQQRRAVV